MSVRVQDKDFDIGVEIDALTAGHTETGAVASFIGKVRGTADGKPLQSMMLEHYSGMTERELSSIEAEAQTRFSLTASLIIHRVGDMKVGDNIVLVITCAVHRQAAFDACAFLMDYLKTRAPFWKKETGTDGSGQWVDARDEDDTAATRWQR